jgi:hypothetical protein
MGGASGDRHSDEQRLHFEDLGGAQLRTRVTRVSEHGLTVEQALPFLRLNGRVHDEAMRVAHIQSVSMVVYDGMPRLVLDLAYEQAPPADSSTATSPGAVSVPPAALQGWPRAAHPGIARARRRDETMSYETTPVAPAAPAPTDLAAFALTVPGETPREDRTRLFRTLPPSQMTLEEQMVRSGQFGFRLHRQWEQVWQPALESTGIWLRVWGKRCDLVLRPWLLRAARFGLHAGRRGWALASHALSRGRAAAQARRSQRAANAAARVAAASAAAPVEARPVEAAPAVAES